MSQQEPASGPRPPPAGGAGIAGRTAAQTPGVAEARAAIARQLNGPLTALLLYMGEIKQHSRQLSKAKGNRTYLQQVVENALQQTERILAVLRHSSSATGASVWLHTVTTRSRATCDIRLMRGKRQTVPALPQEVLND